MTFPSAMQHGTRLLVWCVVSFWTPGSTQDLATPVTKVTQMLEDMKVKSEKLKVSADETYSKVKSSCGKTISAKKDEIDDLNLSIDKFSAEILQLKTDIDGIVKQINDDEQSHEYDSKVLADGRKKRLQEANIYQRDLSEYTVAIGAVQRAIEVMKKHAAGFLQLSQSRQADDEARAALQQVSLSVRQLSSYSPEGGGLAKDEKMFEEFDSLTTNKGAYKSVAGKDKGVVGILEGLHSTFAKTKTELMNTEKEDKATWTATEENLQKQLETGRTSITTNKGTKAEKEETLTTRKGEVDQSTVNRDSTAKFLAKTKQVCAEKKTSYEEMTKLRANEIKALTAAVDIIKGTVAANAGKLNDKVGKAFTQISLSGQPSFDMEQRLVNSLDMFINKQAGMLHSRSLVFLANRMKVLSTKGPADALAKVKDMISDLIVKLQQDSAAEATQKAWCDSELKKNKHETVSSEEHIDSHTASVTKIKGDLKMLDQEVTLLKTTIEKSNKEKDELIADRAKEKKENKETVAEAKESVEAVQAAVTVLTEYYKNQAASFVQHKKQPDAEGPLASEGGNVIAMLEVVRDGYKTLITKTEAAESKAEELYTAQMTDTKVMIASSETDATNKEKLVAENKQLLPQKQDDLKASETALSDAKTNYDNLKAPCLNGNVAEQRRQQVEAEIAALKEALTMVESYGASFLIQEAEEEASGKEVDEQVPADQGQIQKVAKLLSGIKKDVEKDLAADTKAHKEMTAWCDATISETQSAIKEQGDRDAELVTAIEISTQQKTVLSTQLTNLNTEVAKNTASSSQMSQLRDNDLKAFRKSEKETVVAIASLRSAIGILKKKYQEFDDKDKRDLKGEQAQLKKDKAALNLAGLADNVAKALKLLPTAEFNLALTGETGAILQGFLSRPEELVLPGSKRAGLTQTSSQVGADGKAILGILQSLMDTFTADLKAMQDKERLGIGTYTSTKSAKETQIGAMQSSMTTKEGQLAHYTTMNAQAKEDLEYLRATNRDDVQYLFQVKDQCAASVNEYNIRKTTRDDEIAALAEGISILTAGAGVQGGGAAAAAQPAAAAKGLIHTGRRVRKVFVHHHDSPKKRAVLKIAAPKASKPAAQKNAPVVPKPALAKPSLLQVKPDTGAHSTNSSLHRSLATLESKVRLAQHQISMGPLTGGAIQSVVTQVDVVVAQLVTQKKMEIQKKETCVSEENAATEQRERRRTDKAKLQNEITALNEEIKSATDAMAEIAKQIEELNTNMADAAKTRAESHAAYKGSVKEQVAQQKVLHNAIAALKKFYAGKENKKAILLQATQQPLQSLLDALEQQLRNAGQQITESHTESKGELSKQTAQYDAWARDPNIKTICETGFNAGHSATRFLAQSNATLYEFDLGVHPYGKIAAAFLMDKFPGRIHTLWGDSTVVLPVFLWQRPDVHCDLMVVDGGHTYDVAMADLKNFAKMASPNHILSIDDTPCSAEMCGGPTRAWRELVQHGCIAETQAVTMGPGRGFSVGRFLPCSAMATNGGESNTTQSAGLAKPIGFHAVSSVGQSVKLNGTAKAAPNAEVAAVAASAVNLVAKQHAPDPAPAAEQNAQQKALDEGIKKNKDLKWGDVKKSKAKREGAPKGFSKPLKTHSGTTGIIGILQIILEESESLIKQDVKDEQSEVDMHLANIEKTKQVIATKDRESIMLGQSKADNELKKTQTEQQLKAVETEIEEIEAFLAIVEKQCKTFLSNFASNQAARTQEISDTVQAKEVLMGMSEDDAAALTQLTKALHHAPLVK